MHQTIRIGFCWMIAVSMWGCAASGGGKATLQGAVAEYNQQKFAAAREHAAAVMNRAPTGPREDAAYLAGLSAYRMRQVDEAERRFLTAATSRNPQTAGYAKVMLGQVRLDQRRPNEAARYFTEAAALLEGEDSRKASWHAGLAYREAGDSANAAKWLAISGGGSAQSQNHHVAASPQSTGFALQVGAFGEKKRAERAAGEIRTLASANGMGDVRIIPRRDSRGKPVYLVQFGLFPTRADAAAARAKIGKLEYIVAPRAG